MQTPTADAGPTQTVNAGDMVTLDAGNSNDPDGDNLNYHWRQVTGKNVMLSDIHIANPTFNAPNVNSLTHLKFALLVDDGIYSSSPSSVEIVVNPLQKSSAAMQSDSNSITIATIIKYQFKTVSVPTIAFFSCLLGMYYVDIENTEKDDIFLNQ